ncbi:PglZ domain protein [Andreesenia angusta]|uniref:PglZ domain protein n=1 Tax=Andreesenia angusta TaxID=39480 RepID=A0A1S1VC71_9FIRM|nr:PglZ domain-containing protein [Andreesenia angusta]OHW63399.1 PglZ domain protein [Andreesenia angusta]
MFKDHMIKMLSIDYESRILVFDYDDMESKYGYNEILVENGFRIIKYEDPTEFRFIYESEIKHSDEKFAVIVKTEGYVPYDIIKSFYSVELRLEDIFPRLNKDALIGESDIDIDLVYEAYGDSYEDMTTYEKTSRYIDEKVYGKENIAKYVEDIKNDILSSFSQDIRDYKEWIQIAKKKGKAEYLAAMKNISVDFSFIDDRFKEFIFREYKMLSGNVNKKSPIMVNRVMDFITKEKSKVALIVLDGMSIFDFNIISSEFKNIEYEEDYIYAMIPTMTSISRQSLLSGKLPKMLENPFKLTDEQKEFKSKAKSEGYLENQILYARGYDFDIGHSVKCVAVILNDIDDLVHAQLQGRTGMYNDISYLAKSKRIQKLIHRLSETGFDIYITSDHGNTLCRGLGRKRTGVEVETKSKRMIVMKDFAEKEAEEFLENYGMIKYPGYYMSDEYTYLVCDTGTSFDDLNSMVMTHGGVSIEEIIVPFIKVKAVHHG